MENHSEKARACFLQGYNCAQSVAVAFCRETGLDEETAARMASSFGGGMGRMREVCGAVTGMFLAAGMIYGYSDPKDNAGKKELYGRVQELAAAFCEKNGTILCHELLGLPRGTDDPTPARRTEQYYRKRPCAELVADAAAILEKMLKQDNPKQQEVSP